MGRVSKAPGLGSFGQASVGGIGGECQFKAQPQQIRTEADAGLLKEQVTKTIRGKVCRFGDVGKGDRFTDFPANALDRPFDPGVQGNLSILLLDRELRDQAARDCD